MSWIAENPIPNKDFLYTRVHKQNIDSSDGMPEGDAFRNTPFDGTGKSLSSDWCKYANANSCRNAVASIPNRNGIGFKNPDHYFVWKMNVGKIRSEINPSQDVLHTPSNNNRAHSSIVGKKYNEIGVNNAELTANFISIGTWEIAP